MPCTSGATISISPGKAAKGACQREVSSLDARTSFTRFRSSIPDVERFSQEFLYQCSHWRASAYVGGPNLLTWEDIYQEHYVPSIRFTAPTVISRWNKPDGILIGRDELRRHFKRGLDLAPHLHFELIDVLMGVDGVTIIYRRETGALVADIVVLDENYQGVEVHAYYGVTPP